MKIERLIEKYKRLQRQYRDIYDREIFNDLESEHRIVGIVGGRGVGKTTYLFDYLNKNYKNSDQALYVSADDQFFSANSLQELARTFIDDYDGQLLCIDEIHRYPNWSQELKNIYDEHGKKIKIIFSGSSSIDLIKEKYDLSRRAVLRSLPGFSFREFLEFKTDTKLPILSVSDIVRRSEKINKINEVAKILGFYKEYLQIGYYPIFIDFKSKDATFDALSGVIDKVVNVDIPTFFSLKTETLPIFKKILYFILTIPPGSINVNKLASSLQKSNPDTGRYIEMLKESGLVRYLLNDRTGHSLIRRAEKVYLNDTNLLYALANAVGKNIEIGTVRELFVLNQLKSAGYSVFFTKKGDFSVIANKKLFGDEYTFEIGGKKKREKQIKDVKDSFLVLDDILIGDKKRIPIYLFGFLY